LPPLMIPLMDTSVLVAGLHSVIYSYLSIEDGQ